MNEPKIVNLDDEAKAVDIVVAHRTFHIARITLRIRQLYGQYLIFSGEYLNKVHAINEAANQVRIEGKSEGRLLELQNELDVNIEKFAYDKATRLSEMLKTILEKNGYEYEEEWWSENSDYNGMERFIVAAISKDETEGAVSAKKEMEN
jgi:hypothetical protein